MKQKILIPIMMLAMLIMICACGKQTSGGTESEEIKAFRQTIDTFNSKIVEIDQAINSIDVNDPSYRNTITLKLADLNTLFADFANVDFPSEFDYLEHLADEASEYMGKAVTSYSTIFSDDSLDSESISVLREDADTNYANAFKRIKVIMTFLNGEVSQDANVSTQTSGTLTETP
jgi:hypothetical protein